MKFIIILLAKLLIYVCDKFGKGTSFPGLIALKIKPDILKSFVLPEKVIAVTGSNGKTSTAEMIADILDKNGKTVFFNKEGSNQIEGITTLFLKHCDLKGRLSFDAAVLECDERYTRLIFRHIKPTHFVIINLYRDQLTRNGHPYYVLKYIKEATQLMPDATLILNADDPIISSLGIGRNKTLYFGMEENKYSSKASEALYNDCAYCPICKAPMKYEYFQYAHQGKYSCTSCDFSRPEALIKVSDIDLDNKEVYINDNKIQLAFPGRYNIYNLCAAFAAANAAGIDGKDISSVLSEFISKNGRVVQFTAGENKGILLTSKHENSTSYNQSIEYAVRLNEPSTVVFIVDEISRKYYTSETGWLWDVSFELLQNTNVNKIILTGNYCYDLALRFEVAGINSAEIITEPDLDKMAQLISAPSDNKLIVITCFSDKDKLYSRVNVLSPTAK